MWTLDTLNRSYGHFFTKIIVKFLHFWSNCALFSTLSDNENQKRATTYVCAIKNELVRRTIMKLLLTHCNYLKDHSKHKFGTMEVFPKISQPLQTSTVDFQKAFFALIR